MVKQKQKKVCGFHKKNFVDFKNLLEVDSNCVGGKFLIILGSRDVTQNLDLICSVVHWMQTDRQAKYRYT